MEEKTDVARKSLGASSWIIMNHSLSVKIKYDTWGTLRRMGQSAHKSFYSVCIKMVKWNSWRLHFSMDVD